ncbi:MAG: sulfatase-like hydrolase/transferase [Opitutaceae bacterium]
MNPSRPNILVLMTDQHRYDALSCRGHPHVRTPHLDALVSRSVDFRSAYTQAPVCAPARYSLATGQYVASHGVRFNDVNPLGPIRTLAHLFRDEGYRCFQAGHMHWSSATTDTGYEPLISREMWLESLPVQWSERFRLEHETPFVRTAMGGPSPLPESAFWGHFVARNVNRLIDEAVDGDEPFFCWASIYEPHPPFFPPVEAYAAHQQDSISLPAQDPEDAAPPELRQLDRRRKWEHLTDVEIRQMMAGYFGMVEVADRSAGAILQHLRDRGLLDNTWIIWTSDHGEQLFDHRLFLKFCMYEQSVHVPFCVSGPGISPGGRDELVEHVDLLPTLCDIAGIGIPQGAGGRSLEPLLHGRPAGGGWREAVFSQINDLFMIRTRDWKLIVRDGIPVELYDLNADPGEFENRLGDPTCAGIVDQLEAESRQHPGRRPRE